MFECVLVPGGDQRVFWAVGAGVVVAIQARVFFIFTLWCSIRSGTF